MGKRLNNFITGIGVVSGLIGIICFVSGKVTLADFVGTEKNIASSNSTVSSSQFSTIKQQDLNNNLADNTKSAKNTEATSISNVKSEQTSAIPSTRPSINTGSLSNDPSATSTQIPKPKIDDNYLKIKIDGVEKKYFIPDGYIFFNNDEWCLNFESKKFDPNDSIWITLPPNIAAGDLVKITTYNPQSNGWLTMPDNTKNFIYTTDKGNRFLIDGVKDGRIDVKINKWEGRGGYATGTIEGFLVLNDVDRITFSNGIFKVRIEEKPY